LSDEKAIYYPGEPLRSYMDAAASGSPAPGGGSVSAAVGALGAALVSMVGNLTIGKEKFAAVEEQVKELISEAERLRRELILLLQDDTTAYNGVIAAYKLPRDTEEEKTARHRAIQQGLIVAADVPLKTCRAGLRVCELAQVAAEIGNPNAITDAGVAALLGEAAAQGAALNVEINLGQIDDENYKRTTSAEIADILTRAASLRDEVLRLTRAKL
jgi:glutamate formiminotransferase/formiminotetrahydrofolate cyclodeaminase